METDLIQRVAARCEELKRQRDIVESRKLIGVMFEGMELALSVATDDTLMRGALVSTLKDHLNQQILNMETRIKELTNQQ